MLHTKECNDASRLAGDKSRIRLLAVWLFVSLAVTACAAPIVHNTASGKVEATISATADQVKPAIVSQMVNMGAWNITKDTPYQIALDKPVDNVLAVALLGSKYDAQPNARITYTFAQMGAQTRVIADFAIITNPGSAFERRTEVNGNADTMKFQSMLDQIALRFSATHS